MPHLDRTNHTLAAAGLVLAPLLVLLLPSLLADAHHTTAEAQFRDFADGPAPYGGLLLQATGAALLGPAALAVAAVVATRRRGTALGVAGAALGALGAAALLLALGVEFAQGFTVREWGDREAAVALALDLNQWSLFTAFLLGGLAVCALTLPVLLLALWRSGIVPLVVPALFLLPVLVGFLPLSGAAAQLAPTLALLVPCTWAGAALLRGSGGGRTARPLPEPTAAPAAR